jgi:hypothetical protein
MCRHQRAFATRFRFLGGALSEVKSAQRLLNVQLFASFFQRFKLSLALQTANVLHLCEDT